MPKRQPPGPDKRVSLQRWATFVRNHAQAIVACATMMERLRQQHRRWKRYADLMIDAMVIAGQHILVTRNRTDFVDVLPATQLANWIDDLLDAS